MGVAAALVLTTVASTLMHPSLAQAKDPFKDACSLGGGDSTVCKSQNVTTNPLVGQGGVLNNVIDILSLVGGIVVVIVIIIAGIKYITAGGDSSATASAKNTIIYGLIGLIVIILARSIIGWVLTRVK